MKRYRHHKMTSHNQQNNDFDLALAVGQLQGTIDGIAERLDKMNGTLSATVVKVNKHDILFGKIGVVVAGIGFFISVVSNTIWEWVEKKFFNGLS